MNLIQLTKFKIYLEAIGMHSFEPKKQLYWEEEQSGFSASFLSMNESFSFAQSSASVPCSHSAILLQRAILGIQSGRCGHRR